VNPLRYAPTRTRIAEARLSGESRADVAELKEHADSAGLRFGADDKQPHCVEPATCDRSDERDGADSAAAQAGDVEAMNELLRRHRHGVYRYGLHVCRTTEDAEDAVQEALWAATRAITTFRGAASSIVSWMFTIVRRECYRLIDKHRETPIDPADAAGATASGASDPLDRIASERRTELLAAALSDLDPTHREVVLLRDIEQVTAREAAARLGISVQAMKSRLHRARMHLRDHVLARANRF
jgi:RNA polymerase sigma-70 factor (ECF subfamily)